MGKGNSGGGGGHGEGGAAQRLDGSKDQLSMSIGTSGLHTSSVLLVASDKQGLPVCSADM